MYTLPKPIIKMDYNELSTECLKLKELILENYRNRNRDNVLYYIELYEKIKNIMVSQYSSNWFKEIYPDMNDVLSDEVIRNLKEII